MAVTTVDLRRELHWLYAAKRQPALVDVPELGYLWIDGHGAPATPEFTAAVQALYSLAYTAKFALKRAPDGIDYPVMPLEGLWSVPDMAAFTTADKGAWDWSLLIVQPDAVTADVIARAAEDAARKRPSDRLDQVRVTRFREGPAAQVLHVGPYADEGPTIERLHAFIAEHGLRPHGRHHEIYLGDPRRSAPERLRTILRQPVRDA